MDVPQQPQPELTASQQETQFPHLQFPDGLLNVISSDEMRFKLHPGFLCYHSTVLESLLNGLQSPPGPLTIGSSSVYRELTLHLPEKGCALGELFTIVYDGYKQYVK